MSGEAKVLDICLALIHACMCVCTCVHMCAHVHVCVHVCVHICKCVWLVTLRVFLDCSPLYFKNILHYLFVCICVSWFTHGELAGVSSFLFQVD